MPRYSLDTRYSGASEFFRLDPLTGRLTVRRALKELELSQAGAPVLLRIIAQVFIKSFSQFLNCLKEVELAGEVASRTNKLDNQRAAVEIAIIVDNVLNRKPRFLQAT